MRRLDGTRRSSGRRVGVVTEQGGCRVGARRPFAHVEQHGRIDRDHRRDGRVHTRVAAFALEIRVAHRACQQERQVAAGGVARHRNLVRCHGQSVGVGAEPAQRRLDVVDLRRPGRFGGQAVLDRRAGESVRRKRGRLRRHHVLRPHAPTAAVDHEHAGTVALRRTVDVRMQVAPAAGGDHDVSLDRDFRHRQGRSPQRRGGRSRGLAPADPPRWRSCPRRRRSPYRPW